MLKHVFASFWAIPPTAIDDSKLMSIGQTPAPHAFRDLPISWDAIIVHVHKLNASVLYSRSTSELLPAWHVSFSALISIVWH